MKIFCMSCGKGFEYIGEHNKPSVCSCGADFKESLFASSASVVKIPIETKPIRGCGAKSFVIDGEKFDILALAASLTPEFVDGYKHSKGLRGSEE